MPTQSTASPTTTPLGQRDPEGAVFAVLHPLLDAKRHNGGPIALACAKAYGLRKAFGLEHPGRNKRDAAALSAAVPPSIPGGNRHAVLQACREKGLDAEASAFVSACVLAETAGGGLWYFALACQGLQVGGKPPTGAGPTVIERMASARQEFPALHAAFRRGMRDPMFVPTP